MKLTKYILGMGLALALFTACDTDNIGEEYALTTQGVTFATSGNQSVNLPATGYEGFDVEVLRGDVASDVTVKLSAVLVDSKGAESALPTEIKVPESVSFKAGEGTATIHVTVGDITSGLNYNILLSVDAAQASVGAVTAKTVVLFRDYTFSAIGKGKLISEAFGDESGTPYEGEFEWEKADDISWYKALSPYEKGYDVLFKVGKDGKTVLVEKQAIMPKIGKYGTAYVAGSGTLANGVIDVTLDLSVEEGSFGTFHEQFVLPTGK